MPVANVADLVEAIDESRVLPPDQVEKLRRELQPRFPDPPTLARELIRLGWLTPYQAQALLLGKGQSLVLGPYVVQAPLGEGGMGALFKAKHQLMRRVVALKVIRKGHLPHPDAVRRFEQEIRAAAALSHPNIVMAYDAGRTGESHFFVMEFVEGTDLGQVLSKHGPFPVAYACDCARQAAMGLQHAHEQGLVHRDIKPANLLLARGASQSGGRGVVKILDMGLARLRYDPTNKGSKALTQLGAVMGTPNYIAPEQTVDAHVVDIRADIYSLGCTLYHLLTGQPPFPEGDLAEKLRKHQTTAPQPIRGLRPEVPEGLAAVLAKMMAKRPEDRYQTPAEVSAALEPFARTEPGRAPASPAPPAAPAGEAGITAAAPLPPPSATRPNGQPAPAAALAGAAPAAPASRRRRWIAGGIAACLLLLLLFFLLRPAGEPQPEKQKDKYITNSVGMKLALIPPGEFVMGSPPNEEGHHGSEGPQRRIHIPGDFYLGIHEVTQGQYEKVMGSNPAHFKKDKDGGPDFPVENVSWSQALEFCYRLSELSDEQKAGRLYRLPTAAEWEYACRAGTNAPFSFGSSLSSWQANFDGRHPYGNKERGTFVGRTMKVGSFPANAFGLHDMHGNVWEWCADWFDAGYYKNERTCPSDNPQGPVFGPFRVYRGGSYSSPGVDCRAAVRGISPPSVSPTLGFRVVCEDTGGKLFPKRIAFGRASPVEVDRQFVDQLDPARLPPENKFDGLPKSLRWVLGEHRVRHDQQPLSCLAVHPDETLIASGSFGDGTIRLGDPATLRELKTIPIPTRAQIWALQFSPDGKLLASGTADNLVRLWDVDKGTLLRTLEGHSKTVCCLAFSRDGKFLASGGHDGKVRIWNVETAAKVRELTLPGQGVRSVEFSPDGKQLLTGGNPGEGTVKLWDWDQETPRHAVVHDFRVVGGATRTLADDKQTYVAAAFSPDGKEIVTGCSDKTVRLFLTSEHYKPIFRGEAPAPVESIAYAPDGKTFASGAYTNAGNGVQLWVRKTLQKRADLGMFWIRTDSVKYYPKSARLTAPYADTMLLWDVAKGQQIRPPYGHTSSGTALIFAPEGRYVYSSSARDGTVRRWDLRTNSQLLQLGAPRGLFALSPDGAFVLGHYHGGEIISLWDLKRNAVTRHFQGEMSNAFECAAVSPNARYVAAGGHDNIVRVWDVETGKMAHRITGFPAYLRSVLFTPGGNELLTAAAQANVVGLWDLASGNKVREFEVEHRLSSRLALSRDGTRLLAGNALGDLMVWDVSQSRAAPQTILAGHKGPVLGVAVAPDAQRYASTGADGKVLLWEAGSKQPALLAQLPWAVPDVAFSPDGDYLAFINTHFTGTVYILRVPRKGQ
jgi:serine/threonine-protein kinase